MNKQEGRPSVQESMMATEIKVAPLMSRINELASVFEARTAHGVGKLIVE
ncbi:hypothetical protein [Sedimenticola selenatireducens]|nr:hypothetical protein [Sedimenticola selenatireducens]